MIDVSPDQLQIIKDILKRHAPDCEVRAFGSRFKWTAKDYSDLDLVFVADEKLPFKKLSALKNAFEESDLPFRVDVLDWHSISPEFQKVIEQGYEVIQKRRLGVSSSEWKRVTLGEVADVQTGPFGSQLHQKDYVSVGTPIITVEHLAENHLTHEDLPRVTDTDKQRLSKYTLKEGDIVFSRVGSVDRRALVKKEEEGWLFSGRCLRVRPISDKLNSTFLSYYFGLDNFKKYIRAIAVGSTMPSLNTTILSKIEIPLPPLPTQRRIADILSALDEKIELNRQTNATLEAIAQAIFREWFVAFNYPLSVPRLAGLQDYHDYAVNRQGNQANQENQGQDMVESALGPIPKGWRVGKLGEIVDINMGQSPPGESYNQIGDGIIFFQGKAEFGFRFPTIDKYTTKPKRFAKKFDTLLSVRAPVGTVNMATEKCCIGRGLAAISGKNNAWSFTFYLLKNLEEHFNSYEGTGTVFGSINKTELENITVVIPPQEIISEFERVANSIDMAIFNNEQQSATLAAVRDALLPKLMSGEIEVMS